MKKAFFAVCALSGFAAPFAGHAATQRYMLSVTTNDAVVTVRAVPADIPEDQLTLSETFTAPEVREVVFSCVMSTATLFQPDGDCTFDGGMTITNGQLRVNKASALGFGPVWIGDRDGNRGNLYSGAAMDVTNRLVFCHPESTVFGTGSTAEKTVTIHHVASSNAAGSVAFGRSGKGSCFMRLMLDDPASEPVNFMRLCGAGSFMFDGGILKARSTATGDFIRPFDTDSDPKVSWTAKGLTFDAEEGADVSLGLPPDLSSYPPVTETNVVAFVSPAKNGSFEEGSTAQKRANGWTATKVAAGAMDSGAGVKKNGDDSSSWMSGAETPYGDYVYALRSGWSMETTEDNAITVPETGDWFVNFVYVTRSGYVSDLIDITVTLTKVGESEGTSIVIPHDGSHTVFTEKYVGPFALETGSYILKVENSQPTGGKNPNYSAVCFDNFNLRQIETREVGRTTLTKLGRGALRVDSVNGDRCGIAVSNGTLRVCGSVLSNAVVTVASGAAGEITRTVAGEGTGISVESGGLLAVSDLGDNLVANPSFEEGRTADDVKRKSNPKGWGWIADVPTPNPQNLNGEEPPGVQGNGCDVTEQGPMTTAGMFTAYFREGCRISQSINVPCDGRYRVSFIYARRKFATNGMRIHARIGGTTLTGDGLEPSSEEFRTFLDELDLSAGEQTLEFEVTGEDTQTPGPMGFVDDVRIQLIGNAQLDFTGSTLNLRSGAAMRFDNFRPVTIDEVYVDGVRINGGKSALRKAGITVTGSGAARIGDPTGLMLILR